MPRHHVATRGITPRLVLFILFCFAVAPVMAQSTGRITGTVTDPSGAVIANAKVACTNTGTGFVITAQTSAEGIFQCPEAPIGSYEVSATVPGFQTQIHKDITLLTSQVLELRFVLKIGSVGEQVEVVAEVPLVQTASSTVQASVAQKQMQDLPLNGRNALQLVTLTAGAQLTDTGTLAGQQDNRGLTVNGLRATENNVRLDGGSYNNVFFGSIPILPNPDTLEEFTVQSSNYTATSSGAGALIEISTRSGTNQYHGTAFEFLRNTDLNARNFFSPARPPFKQNQYGGTFGGPIRKDKTFFFFAYQGQKTRSAPSPVTITTPSQAERNGDFSAIKTPIINPATSKPFDNNQIPASQLDPLAVKVAATFLPLPNSGANYTTFQNRDIDDDQYLIKIDQSIGGNNRLTGRYFLDDDDFQRPFNAPLGFFAANSFRNQSATLRDTHIFSPNLTGVFSFSFGRYARTQVPQAPGMKTIQDLGANAPLGTGVSLFPGVRVNIAGFVNIFSGGALQQKPTVFDWHAGFNYIRGPHLIQFGADIERVRSYTVDFSFTPGTWTFTGARTGSALTDFYLGLPATYNQDSGRTNDMRQYNLGFFFQDDWKIRPNLTLNIGMRYEPWLPPNDLKNNLVGFAPGAQSTIAPHAPRGLVYPGDPGLGDAVWAEDMNNIAPRIGFAWDVFKNGKTVVRGGYGIFYVPVPMTIYDRTVSTQPSTLTVNLTNPKSFTDPFGNVSGGSPFPRARINPDQFANFIFTLPVSGGVMDPTASTGYSQSWNFLLERQFKGDLAVSLGYVGNHGLKIVGSRQYNPAVYIPGSNLSADARRVYQGFSQIEIAQGYEGSNYHSLQLNVTKRTRTGLTLLGNYVYGRIMDNNSSTMAGNIGPRNPFNIHADYGPADFDVAHRAAISAVYDLPKMQTSNRVFAMLVNGWQMNTIVTLQTGNPFSILSGSDRSQSGDGNNDNADVAGNWARPSGANQLQQYFNTAAFRIAAPGTYGNTGRNILRAPGRENIDMSIFKMFPIAERLRLQFRAEAFNIQNRANFLIQPANAGTTATFNVNSPNFGKILAADDPRVFQFGLKLMF